MKKEVMDRLGRKVAYEYPPKRIISLCPGITDTLFALGLSERIVGRTRFCIHPAGSVKQVPAVAGTKDLKLEAIIQAKPDLIILEKEENTKEMADTLSEHFPVNVAEVQSIQEGLGMITDMGELTDRKQEAETLVNDIRDGWDELRDISSGRAAYVIWKKPYMAAGRDTYITDVLRHLGLGNPFALKEGRYPVITEEDFEEAGLDLILLASEPYPFKEKQKIQFTEMFPGIDIKLIDGEMFWYGPRMLEAIPYFKAFFGK